MYIDRIIQKLISFGVNSKDFKGCTLNEVKALEVILNHKLPKAYKEFMLTMGHGVGGRYFVEAHMLYHNALRNAHDNKEYIDDDNEEIAEEGRMDFIPDDAFFFSYDNKIYFEYYFRLNDPSPDPIVYYYFDLTHIKATETFTDFLDMVVSYTKECQDHMAKYK